MADEQQRSGDSRAASRARRAQQREEWERLGGVWLAAPHSEHRHVTETFAVALGALLQAAAVLPTSVRATQLQARLARISAAANSAHARESVRALIEASELTVRQDPWMRFHLAALHLAAVMDGTIGP
jgi:hypothetical protein